MAGPIYIPPEQVVIPKVDTSKWGKYGPASEERVRGLAVEGLRNAIENFPKGAAPRGHQPAEAEPGNPGAAYKNYPQANGMIERLQREGQIPPVNSAPSEEQIQQRAKSAADAVRQFIGK